MPEKIISKCDRCNKGHFDNEGFDKCAGLKDEGPLGYAAKILYIPKEKNGYGSIKTIILCRSCFDKILPIITEIILIPPPREGQE